MGRSAVTTEAEKVVVIPEAGPPPRRLGGWLLVAVALAFVALVAVGAIVYVWQLGRVSDAEAALARAGQAQEAAEERALKADSRVQELSNGIGSLRARLAQARTGLDVLFASKAEASRLLMDLRRELEVARLRLAAATEPPFRDGRHIGQIVAIGSTHSPPRLVFDPGRWFTGRAAVKAARGDGAIGAKDGLPSRRYFRNASPRWRIVEVAPDVKVTLRRWKGALGPIVIPLARLEKILGRRSAPAERISRDPFWITVRGALVVTIRQQPYVAP